MLVGYIRVNKLTQIIAVTKSDTKLIEVVEHFIAFTEEKSKYQRVLHDFHDAALDLNRALGTSSVEAIASEEKVFADQVKKVHVQANHFDQQLREYRKAATAAAKWVKKISRVTVRGKVYKIIRAKDKIDVERVPLKN